MSKRQRMLTVQVAMGSCAMVSDMMLVQDCLCIIPVLRGKHAQVLVPCAPEMHSPFSGASCFDALARATVIMAPAVQSRQCHCMRCCGQVGAPPLAKRMDAELGCVTPYIVVPGAWTAADMEYYADEVVAGLVNNAGHNCTKAELLVTSAEWPLRDALVAAVRCAHPHPLPCRAAAKRVGASSSAGWPLAQCTGACHAVRASACLSCQPAAQHAVSRQAQCAGRFGAFHGNVARCSDVFVCLQKGKISYYCPALARPMCVPSRVCRLT